MGLIGNDCDDFSSSTAQPHNNHQSAGVVEGMAVIL